MNMHSTNIAASGWSSLDAAGKAAAIIAVYNEQHNTASTIASRLSRILDCDISRNSIIGVYHRVNAKIALKDYPLKGLNPLLKKSYIGRVRAARLRSADPSSAPKITRKALPKPKPVIDPDGIPEMRVDSAPEPLLKTLMEMHSKECRWPIDGDRAMTRFCCHEVDQGRPYCSFHNTLSRGRGTPYERAAHRISKRNAA